MINRPILVVTLGYLIGIIIGLYCKISIAFFMMIFIILYFAIENKAKRNIKRYCNIFNMSKILIIFSISALIANTMVLIKNNLYETKYQGIEEASFIATIVSEPKIKQYSIRYKIRVESINQNTNFRNTYLYLNVKENSNLKYGDKIKFIGNFIEPEVQRNYGGFNYKEYLKSIEIYGIVRTNHIEVIGKGRISPIKILADKSSNYIKQIIYDNVKNKDNSNLLLGILLGNDDELEDSIKENFRNSSLSHILAVSGMHVSYVILGIGIILSKLKLPKKTTKIFTIILLIFFIFLTKEMPSVKRASIMAILAIRSKFIL